jgi:hypothetical protein
MPIIKAKKIRYMAWSIVALACVVGPTKAAEPTAVAPRQLTIELNNLEQRRDTCRLTLLIENKLGSAIDNLGFELVLFDNAQRIKRLLAVAAGSFPRSKSRVRQFDLPSTSCSSIGRVLLNAITSCAGDGMSPDHCLNLTQTRSRITVELAY